MTSFGGLSHAGTALRTSACGLQVVSRNLASAGTAGYTEQVVVRVLQKAIDSVTGVPTSFTKPVLAGGVDVRPTSRITDPVLAARQRTETARSGLAETTASRMSQLEALFDEPSESGLSEQLNDYWNAWSAVANDPGRVAPRTVLLQRAVAVASTLNAIGTSLGDLAASTAQGLGDDLDSANSAATELVSVNEQLAVAGAGGTDANALLDRRDVLLGTLSRLVGAVATIRTDGTASVQVGAQQLVGGTGASFLAVGVGNAVTVDGNAVTVGGTAAAEVAALTTAIPGLRRRLDAVAEALRSMSNAVQAAGFDRSGNVGAALFTGDGASTIAVALSDPSGIAAASTPGGTLDGGNARAAAAAGTAAGSPDRLYAAMVSDLAASCALAQRQRSTQDAVTSSITALLTSVSGVSTDERISSLLTYQRACQAASRVLTTMDAMLDTLINDTEAVGQA